MDVRPASVADAAAIAQIHVASWQSGYRGLIPQDFLDGLTPNPLGRAERLKQVDWSRGGYFVVTDDDGSLAGFADIGQARDSDSDPELVGEVRAIYLAPGAWGKGLGRALMTAALAQLTSCGYREATLWVLDTNTRAQRFYEAAGFKPDGAVKVDDARGLQLHEVRYRRSLLEPEAEVS